MSQVMFDDDSQSSMLRGLTRRGAEAPRLSKDRSTSPENALVGAFARLVADTFDDDRAAERLAETLQEPFPWMEFLDDPARAQFVGDFLHTAHACASVGRFDRLGIEVASWQETAVAYSLGLQDRPSELEYLAEHLQVEDPRDS